MNGWEFLEAIGWGSLILLIWLLILGEVALNFGTGLALVFFFIVAGNATGKRSDAEKVVRKSNKG